MLAALKNVVMVILFGLLDLLIAMVVFIPMRLIKIVNHKPFDEWLYSEKSNSTTAVVLVHGSGVNEAQFVIARNIIEDQCKGKVRVYSCDLNEDGAYFANSANRIEAYSARLEYYIRNVVHIRQTDRLILVGHSMGGLVAGFLADRIRIDLLITIGTPWQGAPALKWINWMPSFNTERHLQMTPGSDFLQRCIKKVSKSNIPVYTIGCKYDFQVPEKSAHMGIVGEYQGTIYTGHISAIVMPYAIQMITRVF